MISLITGILLQFFMPSFLSNETTVVEYIQDQGKYGALVYSETDPDKKHHVELCPVSELDRIDVGVEIYRGKNSVVLYDILVKPLEQYITKKVAFKPVGKIHFINMAALVDRRGHRLCDKYSFRRVSSTEQLPSKGQIDFNETRLLLFGGMVYDADPERMFQNCWWIYRENFFGGPNGDDQRYNSMGPERMWLTSEELRTYVYDSPGWDMNTVTLGTAEDGTRAGSDQLQYSRGEIKFIYSLKGFNIQRFTGDTALEELFKLRTRWGTPCVVHLSTHSFTLDATNSPFSKYFSDKELAYKTTGLMFTGASHTLNGYEMPYEMNDGLLYAEEIALYDFSYIDLLVLSACGTALGTVTNDGVYGIQSAFKEAGAKTIVSTLWSINDRAAAEFMKIFYTYMIEGDTKYEAFEKARRAMIESEDYSDPLYWAPFIMLD